MNHRKKKKFLGKKYGYKKSILSNMSSSLIKKKKIFTTISKAKALKRYIEPIITKSKINTTSSRRNIFTFLRDKIAVNELFQKSFNKVRERYGGYTRIIKIGFRIGDMSRVSLIEFVDFNKMYNSKIKKKIIRRSHKKKKMNNNFLKKREENE
ncbi:50S ribosomal protein L17 [Blattabacterium cuenoti]|nr:50S ribosomal protein L17 [Blattabacterium cuenoti]